MLKTAVNKNSRCIASGTNGQSGLQTSQSWRLLGPHGVWADMGQRYRRRLAYSTIQYVWRKTCILVYQHIYYDISTPRPCKTRCKCCSLDENVLDGIQQMFFLCLDSDNFDVVHLRLLCVGTQQVLMWIYPCVSASCIVFACFCYGSFNLNFISMIQRFKPMNFFAQVLLVTGCFDCTPQKNTVSLRYTKKKRFLGAIPSQEVPGARVPLTRLLRGRFSREAGKHAKQSVIAGITAISCRGDAGGRRDLPGESRTPVIHGDSNGIVAIMQKRQKHTLSLSLFFGIPMVFVVVVFFVFLVFCWGLLIFLSGSVFDPFKTEKTNKGKSTSPPFFKFEPKEEKRCLLLDFCSIDTTGNTALSGRWVLERYYKFVVFKVSWKSLLLRIPRIFRSTMKLPRHKGWTLQPSTA